MQPEGCKYFENTCFSEHSRTTASVSSGTHIFWEKKLKHDDHNTSLFRTLALLSMVHFKDQSKKRPNLKSYIHDSNDIKFLWKIIKYTCLLLFVPWKISNQASNPSFKNMNSKQADGLPFPIKFWHQFH